MGQKNKEKKKYVYDFPEQRKLSKELRTGDQTMIAEKTGYSNPSISRMLDGSLRMPEIVKGVVLKIIEIRKELNSIEI